MDGNIGFFPMMWLRRDKVVETRDKEEAPRPTVYGLPPTTHVLSLHHHEERVLGDEVVGGG